MIAQSTRISYHTEAFFKTEVACTVKAESYAMLGMLINAKDAKQC